MKLTSMNSSNIETKKEEGELKIIDKPVKVNGFYCPLHFLQVFSWIWYAYDIIQYFTITIQVLE